jgi:arabinose-5-phosphate isomerase
MQDRTMDFDERHATWIDMARSTMLAEAQAITDAAHRLGGHPRPNPLVDAVELILFQTMHRGKVVVTGVGKSGLAAGRIAATLRCTGTPAVYLHPVDALHGDLGVVAPGDTVILVSKSGATPELLRLVERLTGAVVLVGILGDLDSPLASKVSVAQTFTGALGVVLDASVAQEADPWGLIPTASTAVATAIGDALAIVLAKARGLRAPDFAGLHPAGDLSQTPTAPADGDPKCAVADCNDLGQLRFCGIWVCTRHGLAIEIHTDTALQERETDV